MPGNETNCYAIRRLCPFLGSLQVIEAQAAQASSSNGIDWRIQVRLATPLKQETDIADCQTDAPVILFGFWSSEGGFHRVPLPPLVSSHEVEIAAQPIIDVLLEQTRKVPFPQHDHYELWLLDGDQFAPLALIAASRDPRQLPHIRCPEWQPTLLADHSFTRHSAQEGNDAPAYTARDAVAELVKRAAGQNPQAQWFERRADGSGKAMSEIHNGENPNGRILVKSDFPELLIRADWPDQASQQLMNDYLAWLAPYLLTLPTLSSQARTHLEQLAFKQPHKVEGQYSLYPAVIDQERLRAILVEAQMRRSNPHAGEND